MPSTTPFPFPFPSRLLPHLRRTLTHNLTTFRQQPLAEISGSLGDLGTFLPILIALSQGQQISLSTTLILTGLFNVLTGLAFGIPLPVQPMKAIAAVAILRNLGAGSVAAAGIFVAACVALFSITGVLEWFTRVVPIPVVKGIQVGAGLSLIIAAGTTATAKLSWFGPSWVDNRVWIVVAFLALFAVHFRRGVPYALLMTGLGVVFALVRVGGGDGVEGLPGFRLWRPYAFVPSGEEWRVGILDAGLGQLPLTTLNSIIAVTHLAADILPEVPTPSVTAVGMSVAAMNFVGVWFGCMPTCHGSGGLAAQYRFGARSGSSIIFLGLVKLVLGLVFGESLTRLLQRFPIAILTVMIIASGLELAAVGESLNTDGARDLKASGDSESGGEGLSETARKRRWTVMMVTAGTLVAFKNDAVGFIAGLCCHASFVLADRFQRRIRLPTTEPDQPL